MTTITKEDLYIIDSQIAFLKTKTSITVKELDNILSKLILKTDSSVFSSNDETIIAMKNLHRLAYFVNFIDDDIEYSNSVFCLVFGINLEDSYDITPDLSNCLVDTTKLRYDIFDLDDDSKLEQWQREVSTSLMLNEELKEFLKENPNPSRDEFKSVLYNFTESGFEH